MVEPIVCPEMVNVKIFPEVLFTIAVSPNGVCFHKKATTPTLSASNNSKVNLTSVPIVSKAYL